MGTSAEAVQLPCAVAREVGSHTAAPAPLHRALLSPDARVSPKYKDQGRTCYTVLGNQGRAQGAEGVEGFSQQPLLPIASHLPVPSTHIIGHSEASHVSHGICGLWGRRFGQIGGYVTGDANP